MANLLVGVALRRAVLGILLDARAPVALRRVREVLASHEVDVAPKRLAMLLDHQRRLGRVRRVERGVYEVVPEAMSPAMRSRCRHWRRALTPSDPPG